MASTHKSLRSGTANKRPTTSIADGQIALNTNTTSPGLFFKDSTGATIIKVGPVHVGTTAPNASPAAGGSSGNSTGEVWLDTSLTPNSVKIWNGASWTNATPIGSTTVQGLLELATNAETQTGTDPDRAVTPAGLQSKVSDSTSTTSSTTIASSTAVKSAYDLANAALPKSGGTVTGNLEIGTTGSLSFEGATADAFETTIAVVDPTADRTITLPDTTGTVVTTGDTGTVTSTMIADGTIVDGDISASAEIAVSKLADGAARQLLQTDAAGTGVEWASNIDVPGTLDVTSTATFDSIASHPLGSAAAPTLTFTGDTNTGIYSPGADQVAISTGGSGRLFVDASGNVGVGASPVYKFDVTGGNGNGIRFIDSLNSVQTLLGAYNSAGFVGTASNHPFYFTVNGSEKMRLTSTGLGIGTSTVDELLHLKGASAASTTLKVESTATASERSSIHFFNGSVSRGRVGGSNDFDGLTLDSSTTESAAAIRFRTGGTSLTTKMTLTSGGSLGIGSTPSFKLDVNTGSNDRIRIVDSASATLELERTGAKSYLIQSTGDSGLRVYDEDAGSERARIDSSGRLLVGTSSQYSGISSQLLNTASAGASTFAGLAVTTYSASSGANAGSIITLDKSNSNSLGTNTAVANNDQLGIIAFRGADGGSSFRDAAYIQCYVDGAVSGGGAADMPGRLVFSTTADGASSPTERMRITEAGEIWINRTTRDAVVGPGCKLQVLGTGAEWSTIIRNSNGATPYGLYIKHDVDANTNTNSFWVGNGGGVNRGYLASNGGLYNYSGNNSNLCDEREKKNIENLESTWDCLKHWELKKFHYNEDADTESKRYGVIAQQVEQHCPEVITEWTKGKDEDGEDILRKGVKEQQMYWMAIKALQEAQVRIEALEAEVAALKVQ